MHPVSIEPKEFSHEPLYSVPRHRVPNLFTRNDPDSQTGSIILSANNREAFRIYLPESSPPREKISPLEESELLWQTVWLHPFLTLC